ncbi:sensor histidine kinase [Brumimicrobium glaciale]|uniref:histidine kinase n=1 Tax=Brumimicrobium glaciale TaxID=200475 RepID=A0A4Q4KH92_9FLAO|nr:sensor histidine kinase [Brumimicrobium glaciale]RYM32561.1 sensor histidine kinase [Brumimicrobium glaciale]
MDKIINNKAAENLFFVSLISAPFWIIWISFDYFFAGDYFYDFIPWRLGGGISSLLIVYLLKKTKVNFILLQSFLFLYFNVAKAYMLIVLDKDSIDIYFQAYTIDLLFMFFILILRPVELFAYSAMSVLAVLSIIIFSPFDSLYILGHGGYVFLAVLIVMVVIGILRYKGVLREAFLTNKIGEATEIEKLNVSLAGSLKEKETLLQEIHHRVKNNLQIISSILSLQNNYVKDDSTKVILRESINRIRSMSVIHETLYKSKNFASINFSDYLLGLTNDIISIYKSNPDLKITIVKDLSDLRFDLQQAIPCGLIVNEIVTNAVKYAFQDRSEGEINLSVRYDNDNVHIEIGDNGCGLHEGFKIEETDSLGLQLVQALVEQIDGTLEIESSNGTQFKIVFPLDKAEKNRIVSKGL